MLHAFFERASHAGIPLVAALVIETRGSTYRTPGALMLFASDGARAGLLSGGCLEGDLQEHAGRIFAGGPAVIDRSYDSRGSDDPVWGLGLGCEGLMRVLLWRLDAEGGRSTLAGLLAAEHRREPAALALDITDGRSVLATGADGPERSPVLSGAVDDARLRAAAMDALARRSASLQDGIFTLTHKALEELLSFGKHTTADKIADAIIFAIRRINYDRQDNTTVGVVKIA